MIAIKIFCQAQNRNRRKFFFQITDIPFNLLQFSFSMGQTHSEKIQQAVSEIADRGFTSKRQLEAFKKDLSHGLGAVEIERFIENPTMENFLPEVIKKRYEAELTGPYGSQIISFKDQSRAILKTRATQLLASTIKKKVNQINSNWKNISEKICFLFIEMERESNIETTLWKIVGEVLLVEWMEIYHTNRKIIEVGAETTGVSPQGQSSSAVARTFPSVIFNPKSRKNQFNLTPLIVNCGQNKNSTGLSCWSIEKNGRENHIEAIFFSMDSELSEQLEKMKENSSKFYQLLMKQFFKIHELIKEEKLPIKQKKVQIISKTFSLMRVFLGIFQEFTTKNVIKIVTLQAQKLKIKIQKQELIESISEEILLDFKKQVNKKVQKLKEYSTKLSNQNSISLFFNQYAILEFICAHTDQSPTLVRINSLFKQNPTKEVRLYNLFPHNKKLRQKLSTASKGLLSKKTALETSDGTFFFHPCEAGRISHIILEIPPQKQELKAENLIRFPISLNPSPRNSKTFSTKESPKNFNLELEQLSINFLKEKDEEQGQKKVKNSEDLMAEKTFDIFCKDSFFQTLSSHCKSKFRKFCKQIIIKTEDSKNSLFNFSHTLDSLIWVQDFTSQRRLPILEDTDIFCLILATLAKNLYTPPPFSCVECIKKSENSQFYNHLKPVQNECSRLFFNILRRSSCNFLCQLQKQDFRKIRTSVIENILSSEEQTLQPFFIFRPKPSETQKILKGRWSSLMMKCSWFSVFLEGNEETQKWIKNLNQSLAEIRKTNKRQNDENQSCLEQFRDKETFLKEAALESFKQLSSLLFNEVVKDEKMSRVYEKIGRNIGNLQILCGIAQKKVLAEKNGLKKGEEVGKNNKKKDVIAGGKKLLW